MLPDEPTLEQLDPALQLRRQTIVQAMHALVHEPTSMDAVRRLRRWRSGHPALLATTAATSGAVFAGAASILALVVPLLDSGIATWVAHVEAGGPPLPIALGAIACSVGLVALACFGWAAAIGREAPLLEEERRAHLLLSRRLLDMDRAHAVVFPPALLDEDDVPDLRALRTPEPALQLRLLDG